MEPRLKPLLLPASLEPGALDARPVESPGDPGQLTRKGRKRKTVTWPEEGKLREYFYFELDETERGKRPSRPYDAVCGEFDKNVAVLTFPCAFFPCLQ